MTEVDRLSTAMCPEETAWADGLFGREKEALALEALLIEASQRGGALVVRGRPGVGKSELLAAASDRASSRLMEVWSVSGVRAEMGIPFAGMHQILRPLRGLMHCLPRAHRDVLLATFGTGGSGTPEIASIAAATLELFTEVTEKSPLFIAVDDGHWLDPESAEALGSVARLEPPAVALLISVTQGYEAPIGGFGIPEIVVKSLDEPSAAALLGSRAPSLVPGFRARVLAEAAGNPLALVELPAAGHRGPSPFGCPDRLPVTERLQQSFAECFLHLPAATQSILLACSAGDGASVSEIVAAAALMGDGHSASIDDLSPAVASGLVEQEGTSIKFWHPLLSAAIYETAAPAQRRRAHEALATVLAEGEGRRAWHRAAAVTTPEDTVAGELEAAASAPEFRGGPTRRLIALQRAAELTPSGALRRRRLLSAAELAVDVGQAERAERLVDEISAEACGALELTRIRLVRDMVRGRVATDPRAVDGLVSAAVDASAGGETDVAFRLLRAAALRSWWADLGPDVRSRVALAARRVAAPEVAPAMLPILAMTDPEGLGEVLGRLGSEAVPRASDPETALAYGTALHMAGMFDRSAGFLASAIAGLREQESVSPLAEALVAQSWNSLHAADWAGAAAAAEEARAMARDLRQPVWEAAAAAALSVVSAIRGEATTANASLAEAEKIAVPMGASAVLADTQFVRSLIALASGDYEEAFEHLQRTFDIHDPAHHYMRSYWRIGELAEAALHAGRTEEARAALAQCEVRAVSDLNPRLKAGLLYARPLLAGDDDAEVLFEAALREDLASWPLYRARLLLQYGVWLRRRRQFAEARVPLRTAGDLFVALGATAWVERARQELRASREAQHCGPESWVQLTEQELQIANMAARGLTNREIGQRLYISPRTVSCHLYHIFPKLGITKRAELALVRVDGRPEAVAL
jgi:DNA-binding CsgD family transcriptional regulator